MTAGSSGRGGDDGRDHPEPSEESGFADVLRELQADGCNLLVVGDAPRCLFTHVSASLLGGTSELRYRLLAVTDASPQSVVERLPDPDETPRSFSDTTEIINHASPPRSVVDASQDVEVPSLGELSERRIVDPQLAGLQAEFAEAMAAFNRRAAGLDPAQLRVGVDSLGSLFGHYDDGVVRRCLQVVTGYVHDYDAMGHYVLTESYESEQVQRLADEFDAVVEVRPVDSERHDHDAEERWHVDSRDMTTPWLPL
jgi:hypothetical protein